MDLNNNLDRGCTFRGTTQHVQDIETLLEKPSVERWWGMGEEGSVGDWREEKFPALTLPKLDRQILVNLFSLKFIHHKASASGGSAPVQPLRGSASLGTSFLGHAFQAITDAH